jgi:hypothetical protein
VTHVIGEGSKNNETSEQIFKIELKQGQVRNKYQSYSQGKNILAFFLKVGDIQ